MKTLDKYIVKNFLLAVLLCFVALMSIRIVADLFLNIDEFAKSRGPEAKDIATVVGQMVTYYSYKSLAYFRELGGVIIVAAAAFTLARMNHTNELTAILASGVSLYRVLAPIVICAMGLSLLVLVDSEVLIPRCKEQLLRERDDVGGTEISQVRLLTDDRNSCWYSNHFEPDTGYVDKPLIVLRDERYKRWGHIAGPSAGYIDTAGVDDFVFPPAGNDSPSPVHHRAGWVLAPAKPARPGQAPEQVRLHISGALAAADTGFVPTLLGPIEMINQVRAKPQFANVDWEKMPGIQGVEIAEPGPNEQIRPAGNLRIRARRLGLKAAGGKVTKAELEDARFIYSGSDGEPLVWFKAERAIYHYSRAPKERGWVLDGARLVYSCDLTPSVLAIRGSSDWMQYMSSSELGQLLRLGRVGDKEGAKLLRYSRFGDFFSNIILLLVGIPFILSRERNVKSSAALTVLTVGGCMPVSTSSGTWGYRPCWRRGRR